MTTHRERLREVSRLFLFLLSMLAVIGTVGFAGAAVVMVIQMLAADRFEVMPLALLLGSFVAAFVAIYAGVWASEP